MIRHLFKLVWNRKRSNALMILETCVSFLVVFGVATLALFFLDNYRVPLGFEWKHVLNVGIGFGSSEASRPGATAAQQATFARLLQEVRALAPVEAAGGTWVVPFDQGGWGTSVRYRGRRVLTEAGDGRLRQGDGARDGGRPLVRGGGLGVRLAAGGDRPRPGARGLRRRKPDR